MQNPALRVANTRVDCRARRPREEAAVAGERCGRNHALEEFGGVSALDGDEAAGEAGDARWEVRDCHGGVRGGSRKCATRVLL